MTAGSARPRGVVLRGQVWAGGDARVLPEGVVVVAADGTVLRLGPATEVDVPLELPTFGGAGHWVGPGLVDAHVHLVFDAGSDPVRSYRALDHEGRLRVALANAQVAIRAGITTVRDLGAPLACIAEAAATIARGEAPGPDIVHAGASITRVGGHLGMFGGEVRDAREARA
ncbi:MAG: amidohydrolase family protein, partial [Acidothermales bacterium]|nr:amidohydrolase family protein [Acidothermales bacterium]